MSGARPDTWMPIYIGDYLADTMHLTVSQHGAYLLLIFAYWRRGAPLPDDDGVLAAIVKVTLSEWRRLKPVLAAFFHVTGGFWHHGRIDHELARAKQRISRGQAGGLAKAKQVLKPCLDAAPLPSPSQSPEVSSSLRSDSSDFDEFWQEIPKKVSKGQARKAWPKAVKVSGLGPIELAKRFRHHCAIQGEFAQHPATWLRAEGWLNIEEPRHDRPRGNGGASAPAIRKPDEGPGFRAVADDSGRLIGFEPIPKLGTG